MRKRLFVSAAVAALSLVGVGGVALAAGGGFGSPGTTRFSDVSATALLMDSTGTELSISVDRGMQTFKLRGVAGPPVMVGPETVLNFSGFNPDGTFINGCVVIPDSAFQVATGLATATLHVDPSVEVQCPGQQIPDGAGGRPGVGNVVPYAGGGGGGGGMTITANLTWTSNGAVSTFSFADSMKCQSALAHNVGTSITTFASVTGSTSALVDVSTLTASIGVFDNVVTVTSAFSSACIGA